MLEVALRNQAFEAQINAQNVGFHRIAGIGLADAHPRRPRHGKLRRNERCRVFADRHISRPSLGASTPSLAEAAGESILGGGGLSA